MIGVITAFALSLVISLAVMPTYIKFLAKKQYGQFVREDGPTQHLITKRGTPTMGGVVIVASAIIGWLCGSLANGRLLDYSGLTLVLLFLGLGVIGFLDDFIKISKHQSLGLNPLGKIIGQLVVGSVFAVLALLNPNKDGLTPGSFDIEITSQLVLNLAFLGIPVAVILFLIWTNFLVAAWSNAVNLTDGLDGLATGCSIVAFTGYILISYWQANHYCGGDAYLGCYEVRDALGIAIFCAAIVGALTGFLWYNASPAKIFMGDTGALALGGAFAGVSIVTNTEILAIFVGGLFVVVTLSDVIQIAVFKRTGKRVFKMAPLHHHFELKGWQEVTIVTRFWIISALFALVGIGIFYADWLAVS